MKRSSQSERPFIKVSRGAMECKKGCSEEQWEPEKAQQKKGGRRVRGKWGMSGGEGKENSLPKALERM